MDQDWVSIAIDNIKYYPLHPIFYSSGMILSAFAIRKIYSEA